MSVLKIINLSKKLVGDCKQYWIGLDRSGLDTGDGYVTYRDCEGIQQTVHLTRLEEFSLDSSSNSSKLICATYILDQSDNVTINETGKNCDGSDAVGPAYPTIGGGSGSDDLRPIGVGDEDTRTS